MTDSFLTRCAVLQGMSTWALSGPRPIDGTPKGNSGVSSALIDRVRAGSMRRVRFASVGMRVTAFACRGMPPVLGDIPSKEPSNTMIILGIILLLIGWLANIGILTTIGIILVVIGAVLFLLGATGRAVGGRKHWY